NTPAAERCASSAELPGTRPPQKPTWTRQRPAADSSLVAKPSADVVGGIEFKGMSKSVVTPPDAAAAVAVANPSHSVRPGPVTRTCASTRPGRTASSPTSTTDPPCGGAPGVTDAIRPPRTRIAAGPTPSAVATRRLTKKKSGGLTDRGPILWRPAPPSPRAGRRAPDDRLPPNDR